MKHFMYAADAGDVSGAAPQVTDTHTRHVRNVPNKDADLEMVCEGANAKWAANPFVTLLWKKQGEFATDTANFKNALELRNTAGGKRPGQSNDLDNIDQEAEDAVPFVKTYINKLFGPKDGPKHYAEFGLIHRNHSYELPTDREKRKDALRMMVDAIAANGFGAETYGTAFWTDIKTRFDAALTTALSGAGTVSADVGDLVILRTTLRRVLHSILLILEANYPDTFEQERRDWGFQKESY